MKHSGWRSALFTGAGLALLIALARLLVRAAAQMAAALTGIGIAPETASTFVTTLLVAVSLGMGALTGAGVQALRQRLNAPPASHRSPRPLGPRRWQPGPNAYWGQAPVVPPAPPPAPSYPAPYPPAYPWVEAPEDEETDPFNGPGWGW